MSAPKRVQMRRDRPWQDRENPAVVVSRPSRWGNPFSVDVYGRDLAICLYRQALTGDWNPSLLDQSESDEYWSTVYDATMAFRKRLGSPMPLELVPHEFRGRDLACWCRLDEACHADVLLEIANGRGVTS